MSLGWPTPRSIINTVISFDDIEVRVPDTGELIRTYDALDWLDKKGYLAGWHWEMDMRGGQAGFTSFYFRDQEIAAEFSLVWR